MTTLIGSRWKCREARSRGVLICPVSRAELCVAQSFRSHFYLPLRILYTGSSYTAEAVDVNRLIKETIQLRVFGSGGLAGGLYPFSFRTRQSSLLAAMVLIVSDGESS